MNKTINHHLMTLGRRDPSLNAIAFKTQGQWINLNWVEYEKKIHFLASALLHQGLKPGQRVVIQSNTRLEWSLCDWACLGLRLVVVPIYQNSSKEEISYILSDAEPSFIFCETETQEKYFLQIAPQMNGKIINFAKSFQSFLQTGEKGLIPNQEVFLKRCSSTQPQDIATLVYTSGTTGLPKGVVLTHEQIISEVSEAFEYVGVRATDRSLSILPYSHVLGRIEHWGSLYVGFQLCFAESIEKVRSNLIEIKPTIMVAVPRIFEKIYVAILTQLEANPLKAKAFRMALSVGKRVSRQKQKRLPLSPLLLLEYKIAQKTILNKITAAFGGKLRFAVSGGAPLSKEICEFFHACDVHILEGYGLTETTAAICVNAPHDYAFGTIGKPLKDVQIKFAEDGEILVQSKKVMKEYYNNPDETAKVFEDGFLKTGDIGQLLSSGHIQITDRKKDLIKTAGGKYVAPQKLETLLSLHNFVSHALIHGDQKKYVVAIISPNIFELKKFAGENGISATSVQAIINDKKIQQIFKSHLAQTNTQLASHETIKRFTILDHEFSIETGELTPSLKVKRKYCDQKYSSQIAALYS